MENYDLECVEIDEYSVQRKGEDYLAETEYRREQDAKEQARAARMMTRRLKHLSRWRKHPEKLFRMKGRTAHTLPSGSDGIPF